MEIQFAGPDPSLQKDTPQSSHKFFCQSRSEQYARYGSPFIISFTYEKYNIMLYDLWDHLNFGHLKISWKKVVLTLKRDFNTAHSSSAKRTNFIVKVQAVGTEKKGYGECGLPPKKPHCYLADIEDCNKYMGRLRAELSSVNPEQSLQNLKQTISTIFEGLPKKYFNHCQLQTYQNSTFSPIYTEMLILIDKARTILTKEQRAPYSALQFAIFDCWARILQMSLESFIFPQQESKNAPKCCSFYTISHDQEDIMIQNTLQGMAFTHFIKIKCIGDIKALLHLLLRLQKETESNIIAYIIDANASWTVQSCKQFFEALKQPPYQQLKQKILYLEQPFPVIMTQNQKNQWKQIHQEKIIKIVADQSFFGEEQIENLINLCSGVNIKTEKAGGVINSLKAGLLAKQKKMDLMLGSMVSTHLGCTQTYCLHPLTKYLDTDGAILVRQPQVKGGFIWGVSGYLSPPLVFFFGTQIDCSVFQK